MNPTPTDPATTYEIGHDQVAQELPWYVNGTLDEPARARVSVHVSDCLVCRRDLAALNALRDAFVGRTREAQTEAALARLHERLDERGGHERYFPWAATAVLVIVTGLAGVLGVNTGLLGNGTMSKAYLTLGARTVDAPENPLVTARIVFAQHVTERQLRELLLGAGAELIDGPTRRGAYTIALPHVAYGDNLQHAVAALRASERVLFVEPIVSMSRSPTAD